MKKLTLLITGAASGIGAAAASYFVKRGHTVYGIDLSAAEETENFHSFAADITDEDALHRIHDRLCECGVLFDAIINVAGIHRMASLVESDFSEMKNLIDINLTGTMLVNRTFHDRLEKSGRIIIITSEVAGFDPMPFNGLYNISKTALDTYAQALRQELNLIGQKVVTIRPGAVETPLSSGSVAATQALADSTVLYREQASRFAGLASQFMGTPIKPEKLAALIYKAATAKSPHLIYKKHQNFGLVLLNILPKRMQCAVIKLLLGTGSRQRDCATKQ